MRTTPSGMTTALEADALRLIYLIEMALSQGTVRYALAATDVTFNGATYAATAGTFSEMEENAEGAAPQFRLVLQNVDGVLGALVDGLMSTGADARGKRVTIRTVEETQIADTSAVVSDTFVISDYRIVRQAVNISLGSPMAIANTVPSRVIGGARCPWVYKGPECGSTSTEKKCGKTLTDCKARFDAGAPLRFGGQMGRSARRQSFFV